MEFSRIKKNLCGGGGGGKNFSSSAKNFSSANGGMFVLRKINSAEGRSTRSYGLHTLAILSNQESNTSIPSTFLTDLDMSSHITDISIHMSKIAYSNDEQMQPVDTQKHSSAPTPFAVQREREREGPIQSSFSRTKDGAAFLGGDGFFAVTPLRKSGGGGGTVDKRERGRRDDVTERRQQAAVDTTTYFAYLYTRDSNSRRRAPYLVTTGHHNTTT